MSVRSDRSVILSKAKATRKWIENIDRNITYPTLDMTGFCLRAAVRLASRIQAAGIAAKVCVGNVEHGMHAYVVAKGYIADVTCTQFTGPKVVVAKKKRAGKNLAYNPYVADKKPVTISSRALKNPDRIRRRYWNLGWDGIFGIHPEDFKRFNGVTGEESR